MTTQMMVRYQVKADRAAENEAYITQVFAQLQQEQPAGLHYASFKLEDGVSFVHIVQIDTTDGSNPLRERSAFQAFAATVQDRCVEPPVSVALHEIGAYKVFAA